MAIELSAAISPLAPFAGLPVGDHFGFVALTQTRAKLGIVAHALLAKSPTHYMTEIDGSNWHVATFQDEVADLHILHELVMLVGSLKTAIVMVRGRYYAPGQHIRLYQWLVCYTSKRAQNAPLSLCDYMTDRIYRLDQDEIPTAQHCFGGLARPEQAISSDPRLREKYRLPCHLLGSFTARQLDRENEAGGREQLEAFAEKEGFIRCPRYVAERLIRVK